MPRRVYVRSRAEKGHRSYSAGDSIQIVVALTGAPHAAIPDETRRDGAGRRGRDPERAIARRSGGSTERRFDGAHNDDTRSAAQPLRIDSDAQPAWLHSLLVTPCVEGDRQFCRHGPYFFPDLTDTDEADELAAINAGQLRATRIGAHPSILECQTLPSCVVSQPDTRHLGPVGRPPGRSVWSSGWSAAQAGGVGAGRSRSRRPGCPGLKRSP